MVLESKQADELERKLNERKKEYEEHQKLIEKNEL